MHFMIDLETLGTDPVTAPIVQIAVVPFTLTGDGPCELVDFQCYVSAGSNEDAPFYRRASADTIKWWVGTNASLLAKIMGNPDAIALRSALGILADYFPTIGVDIDGVWANGPTFDISMLNAAFGQAGMKSPLPFRAERCVRTMAMIAGDDPDCWEGGTKTALEQQGEAHDARVDCHRQIRMVQQTFQRRIK